MERTYYDFSDFEKVIHNIYPEVYSISSDFLHLHDVKNELNSFFKDSECEDVILVNNVDKLFFGINVLPSFNGSDNDIIMNILLEPKSERISKYVVEIDSKLFSESLDISCTNIVALLIKEVSGLISTTLVVDKTKDALNDYITRSGKSLTISKCIQYNELLAFALKDTIHKMSSVFYKDLDKPYISDEFMVSFNLSKYLEDAINTIKNSTLLFNKSSDKLIVLQWALLLYEDIKHRRIDALETIDKCIETTGSYYEKLDLRNIRKQISTIDDSLLLTEFGESIKELVKKIRLRGVANIEDDLYEYAIRIKGANTEDDARLLMREINNRMAILADYIKHEEIPDGEKDRWQKVYEKYEALREKLANKPVAKYKYMQLWVEENPDTLMM